jgi:hypothetical protein
MPLEQLAVSVEPHGFGYLQSCPSSKQGVPTAGFSPGHGGPASGGQSLKVQAQPLALHEHVLQPKSGVQTSPGVQGPEPHEPGPTSITIASSPPSIAPSNDASSVEPSAAPPPSRTTPPHPARHESEIKKEEKPKR